MVRAQAFFLGGGWSSVWTNRGRHIASERCSDYPHESLAAYLENIYTEYTTPHPNDHTSASGQDSTFHMLSRFDPWYTSLHHIDGIVKQYENTLPHDMHASPMSTSFVNSCGCQRLSTSRLCRRLWTPRSAVPQPRAFRTVATQSQTTKRNARTSASCPRSRCKICREGYDCSRCHL